MTTDGHSYPHLKVKRINDRAADNYLPRLYGGRVAVIRSKGILRGWQAPRSDGKAWFEGRLEVHELPVYPRGMLVDPFSRGLQKLLGRASDLAGLIGVVDEPI